MGFWTPTRAARERSGELQASVIRAELDSRTAVDDDAVGQATIHGRQDLVLLVGMQTELHKQLVKISRGVWLLVLIGLAILSALSNR
jgi:hypothetical protein